MHILILKSQRILAENKQFKLSFISQIHVYRIFNTINYHLKEHHLGNATKRC